MNLLPDICFVFLFYCFILPFPQTAHVLNGLPLIAADFNSQLAFKHASHTGTSQVYDTNGEISHFVDGNDSSLANWMRYISCARSEEEQNMAAFQHLGHIYFR